MDETKVFVSRLPLSWDKQKLSEHFEYCFGKVVDSSIQVDQEDKSRGFGFVNFESVDSKNQAIEQGSIHVKHKTIQIRPVFRNDEDSETAKSAKKPQICFQWQKFSCVKGSNCIFSHEGPGSCSKVSSPGEGISKKLCLSFKTKGKCSKGDSCKFLHILKASKQTLNQEQEIATISPKVCHSFLKKGHCRKGERCIFAHTLSRLTLPSDSPDSGVEQSQSEKGEGVSEEEGGKRKRIDGAELVRRRRGKEKVEGKQKENEKESEIQEGVEAVVGEGGEGVEEGGWDFESQDEEELDKKERRRRKKHQR